MLRSALISFALAISVIFLIALVQSGGGKGVSSATSQWGARDANIVTGLPVQSGGGISLQLDNSGRGIVEFDIEGTQLAAQPVLHAAFLGRPDVMAFVVGWRTESTGNEMSSRQVGYSPGSDLWLDMSRSPEWAGKGTRLALVFLGPPGGSVTLESIELKPLRFPQTVYLTLADWMTFVPWRHSSINSHAGLVAPKEHPFPTVVAVGVVFLALLILTVGRQLLGRRQRFDWRALGIVFLLCWLGLDSLWQYKLLRQTEVSQTTFAGKSPHEKRLATDDSALYTFIGSIKEAIGEPDARVFIASASDYLGMRGAYFAYPQNVYWERHAVSLPPSDKIRAGDYVLLLRPIRAGFDKDTGLLRYGEDMSLHTELILSNDIGALFKVI